MFRRAVIALATVALLGPTAASTADTAHEACFRRRVNATRVEEKQRELSASMDMQTIARAHANRMATDETIYHNDGRGQDDDGISLKDESPPFIALGENVGMGGSCEAIYDAFLASLPHHENIVDPDYRQLGVGVVENPDNTIYVVLNFYTPARRAVPPMDEC